MKFNEEESDKILNFHEETNRSAFQKVIFLKLEIISIDNWWPILILLLIKIILTLYV